MQTQQNRQAGKQQSSCLASSFTVVRLAKAATQATEQQQWAWFQSIPPVCAIQFVLGRPVSFPSVIDAAGADPRRMMTQQDSEEQRPKVLSAGSQSGLMCCAVLCCVCPCRSL